MDFDDIFRLLLYIGIPLIISANRKAKKAKKSSQKNRQPVQNERQPVQGRTAGGGLMGRLESMMKEIERSIETGQPIGGGKPDGTGKTGRQAAQPAGADGMDVSGVTDQNPAAGREGYSMERPDRIPVWQMAKESREGKAASPHKTAQSPAGTDNPDADDREEYGLFGRDDLVKGIIMSEILQPPVTIRSSKRRPY